MKMQIIFPVLPNPASQMPRSVLLSKLSYEPPANRGGFFMLWRCFLSSSILCSILLRFAAKWAEKEKSRKTADTNGFRVELLPRFELGTSSLPIILIGFYACHCLTILDTKKTCVYAAFPVFTLFPCHCLTLPICLYFLPVCLYFCLYFFQTGQLSSAP